MKEVLLLMLNQTVFPQLTCRANKTFKKVTEEFSKNTKSVLSKCYRG